MKIQKGRLFCITSGESSDYSLMAFCKASDDLELEVLKAEYLKEHPDEAKDYTFDFYSFTNWLISVKMLAKEVDYIEWHLGNYGIAEFTLGDEEATP